MAKFKKKTLTGAMSSGYGWGGTCKPAQSYPSLGRISLNVTFKNADTGEVVELAACHP